jgi:hypothetical protein
LTSDDHSLRIPNSALLRLLEGTDLVLQAKPPPSSSYNQSSTAPPTFNSPDHQAPNSNDSDPLGRGFGPTSVPLMGNKKGVKDGLPLHGGGGSGGVGGG